MYEDNEIKRMREDWDGMSYEDKRDKFLWKMVWFHHQKHIPGNPNEAINNLTTTIDKASLSSENLTKSIRIATWVAGIAAVAGLVLSVFSFFNEGRHDLIEIKQKVFDECFDHYANNSSDSGISDSLIQACKDRASNWRN